MSENHGRHPETVTALIVTLISSAIIAAVKWTAYALTGSSAIFGEAAHSTADAINPILLYIGDRRSRLPPDVRHPFGYHKEAFFWSLLSSCAFLVIGSALTAAHGIRTLVGGTPHFHAAAIGVMGIAVVLQSGSLWLGWRAHAKNMDTGSSRDLMRSTDTITLGIIVENRTDIICLFVAGLGVAASAYTDNRIWDGFASLTIAAIIGLNAVRLINRNRALLVGETVPMEINDVIRAFIAARPGVLEVRSITSVTHGTHSIECAIDIVWSCGWFSTQVVKDQIRTNMTMPPRTQEIFTVAVALTEIENLRADLEKAFPVIAVTNIRSSGE